MMNENKTTLQDLAKQFDISIERVRQIEKAATEQSSHNYSKTKQEQSLPPSTTKPKAKKPSG